MYLASHISVGMGHVQVVGGEEAGTPADIAAHSRLDREVSGLNCSVGFHFAHILLFIF